MINMKEIPHLYFAENKTDDELFDEIDELEHEILGIVEGYCKNQDLGFGVYMGLASYVRNLMAYAWEAGRRQLRERPEQEEG